MTKKADPDLLKMMEHLQASTGGRGRRSTLFHWLFKRASNFDEMIKDQRPSWSSVATAAAVLDLRDGCGKLPTGERTRKTWFEVRRAKGWLGTAPAPPVVLDKPKPAQARLNALEVAPVTQPLVPSKPENTASPDAREDLLADVWREMNHRSGRTT